MRLFISLLLSCASFIVFAQDDHLLKTRILDAKTHRVKWTLGTVNTVKIKTRGDSVVTGQLKILNDSLISVGKDTLHPEDVKFLRDRTPFIIAAAVSPAVILSPLLLYPVSGVWLWSIFGSTDHDGDYIIVSNLSRSEIERTEIEKHRLKDSLLRVNNPDSSFVSTLVVDSQRLRRKESSTGIPSKYMFVGTDLEKLPVPNFSLNMEYFVKPFYGFFMQAGYKPLNPDGEVFYMTNRTQPYYFCEHYMFRIGPVISLGNKSDSHQFFFFGPTLYYKTMNADKVLFCLYNNGDGDDRYVWYWYDEQIKGIGLRTGVVPKNRLGIGFSFEMSYRISKSHGFYQDYNYINYSYNQVVNIHNYNIEKYICFDASLTLRLKIRKHK